MRKVKLVFLICFVLLFLALMPTLLASDGDVLDVHVYVVCLDGVGTSGVDNTSRVFEGVLKASNISEIRYWTGEWNPVGLSFEPVLDEVDVNISVTKVVDWSVYKSVVESCSRTIIVNTHGQVLPVPAGYAKEEWVDEIANAMANRNVTWVHMAGYPLYNYSHQEYGDGAWTGAGFQRLMSHIGKGDVTCWPPTDEAERVVMSPVAVDRLHRNRLWADFANEVEMGRPLNGSDFQDYLMMSIFPSTFGGQNYYTGAVLAFTKPKETKNFGFYVHLGTRQTYDLDGKPTDSDYWRGYIATAVAIWASAMKEASLNTISEAEIAITEAAAEERVKGLDEARMLLQKAKDSFLSHTYTGDDGVIQLADRAKKAANKAVKPSLLEQHFLHIITSGIAIVVIAVGSTTAWKRKNKNRRRN